MNEPQTLMMEYYELWGRMDDVYDHWAKARGISYTELLFLYTLWETDRPITQRDLCQRWHLPKQTVNSILHALAKREIVVFKESTQDHRRKEILLTTQGMRLAQTVIRELQTHELEVIQTIGISSMRAMLKETKRFLDAFEEVKP